MYDFIKSNFMKEYLESINFEFTDTQKATVIWNNPDFTLYEKLSKLKEIVNETGDEKLQEEILDRINYEKEKYDAVIENNDDCLYEVVSLDSNYNGLFMTYEDAEKYLKAYVDEFKETCNIHKRKFIKYNNPKVTHITVYNDYIGCVTFDKDKEIYHIASYEIPDKGIGTDNHRFENKYIDIPFPFEIGDLVMYKDTLFTISEYLGSRDDNSILTYSHNCIIGYKYPSNNEGIRCRLPLLEVESTIIRKIESKKNIIELSNLIKSKKEEK